ncbi:unnamed protein product [Lupinus luteus]|uniref:RING-CH-type domain-containing protein n=1 Tax=Lupinus luteus TaxID=3873 RepID=A0AAV1WLU5_LUPLU
MATQAEDASTTSTTADTDTPIHKSVESAEITEELPSRQQQQQEQQHGRRQNLILEIPTQNMGETKENIFRISTPPTGEIFSPLYRSHDFPGPSTKNISATNTALIPKLGFKFHTRSDIEKATSLALEGSPAPKNPTISRTLSLTKLISTPSGNKMSSLPITSIAQSNPESTHGVNTAYSATSVKKGQQLPIHRSRSVPVLTKLGNSSVGSMFRVVPTTPRFSGNIATTSMKSPPTDTVENSDGEDIPEEEAVCRICLIELGEGGDTLKMECSCKGELALAHQECAVKWFNVKGNRICDVCKKEVQNLPVTLLRVPSAQALNFLGTRQQYRQGVCQNVPVLVIINMLAYFCFLEQLLISRMGSSATAISIPFSCIVGLLASMTSTTIVRRRYIWVYATSQFAMVVLAGRLFYTLLPKQAVVLCILLSTFTGFGVAMCGAIILSEFLKWRRRVAQLNQQHVSQEVLPSDQTSVAATHQSQMDSQQHQESNMGETLQPTS